MVAHAPDTRNLHTVFEVLPDESVERLKHVPAAFAYATDDHAWQARQSWV
jgi:hypothetical protein